MKTPLNSTVFSEAAELVKTSYELCPSEGGGFSCHRIGQAAHKLGISPFEYNRLYEEVFTPTGIELKFCMDNNLCRSDRFDLVPSNLDSCPNIAWFSSHPDRNTAPVDDEYDYNCRMFALLLMIEIIDNPL